MGMLYRRGAVFWIKYYVNGRPIRESTGTDKERQAERFLKDREGRAATGQPILPRVDRVRVEELLKDLQEHYETTGDRNLREADCRLTPLKSFFTGRRVSALSGADFTRYVQKRQDAKVANGTINRELSMLRTALRLGAENGKVLRLPVIHLLKEAPPRKGFVDASQFQNLRKRLPEDLQVAVTIMYQFGWRLREVLTLTLSQVNLEAGTLRLEPGTTKNNEARLVYLTEELKGLLAAQIDRMKALSRKLGRVVPFLFPHLRGPYKGTQRRDFRVAWKTAVEAVGMAGALKHDFRRSAVRNMERAGVPRSVAMKLTGHKTESVYRRYAIVSDADLQDATRRLTGTFTGTISPALDSPHPTAQNN